MFSALLQSIVADPALALYSQLATLGIGGAVAAVCLWMYRDSEQSARKYAQDMNTRLVDVLSTNATVMAAMQRTLDSIATYIEIETRAQAARKQRQPN